MNFFRVRKTLNVIILCSAKRNHLISDEKTFLKSIESVGTSESDVTSRYNIFFLFFHSTNLAASVPLNICFIILSFRPTSDDRRRLRRRRLVRPCNDRAQRFTKKKSRCLYSFYAVGFREWCDDDIRAGGDDRPNSNNKLPLIYYNITRYV